MTLKTFSHLKNLDEIKAYVEKMLQNSVYEKLPKKFSIDNYKDLANALFQDWMLKRSVNFSKINFKNFAFGSAGFNDVIKEISNNNNGYFVEYFLKTKNAKTSKNDEALKQNFCKNILKYNKNINLFSDFEKVFEASELSKEAPNYLNNFIKQVTDYVEIAKEKGVSAGRSSDSFRKYLGVAFNKTMKDLQFASKTKDKNFTQFSHKLSQDLYPEYYNQESSTFRPFTGGDLKNSGDFEKNFNNLLKYPENILLVSHFSQNINNRNPGAAQHLAKLYVKIANDIFCAKHDKSLPKIKRKSSEFREYLLGEFTIFQNFLNERQAVVGYRNHKPSDPLEEIPEGDEDDVSLPDEEFDEVEFVGDDDDSLLNEDGKSLDEANESNLARAKGPLPNLSPPKEVKGETIIHTTVIKSPLNVTSGDDNKYSETPAPSTSTKNNDTNNSANSEGDKEVDEDDVSLLDEEVYEGNGAGDDVSFANSEGDKENVDNKNSKTSTPSTENNETNNSSEPPKSEGVKENVHTKNPETPTPSTENKETNNFSTLTKSKDGSSIIF